MIWAALALLGVPLWLIAVVLTAVVRNRRQVRSGPDVFEFRERTDTGWSRRRGHARWVSDVLIQHKGPALVRTDAHRVTACTIHGAVDPPPPRLGAPAVELEYAFADRPRMRVVVAEDAVDVAQGGSRRTE